MFSVQKHKKLALALGGVFLVGALLFGFRGWVYAELEHLKLIPVPERFTELYFTTYPRVPQNNGVGNKLEFEFTVHNLQGATTEYPYRVTFEYSTGRSKVIDIGKILLVDNESKSVSGSYTFTSTGERGAIVVELTNLHQEIRFHVSDTATQ